jgi:predicted NBD/HSP70 family sugar kinase
LLRAVGGHRWRGRRRRRRLWRDHRHRHGGGLVVNGRIVAGANAVAGEWGHNPMPAPEDDERPGPPCYCGRSGCIETFLSGPAVARDYIALGGDDMSAADIAARADRGDARARACLDRYERRFARAIASIINVVDPHVIVLGGGLSNITGTSTIASPALWGPYVFSDRVDTRLVRAKHGDASGVRGAAWLWPALSESPRRRTRRDSSRRAGGP